MKPALRFLLTLFTILSATTIASAALQETHAGVIFEEACILEGESHFSASLFAPKNAIGFAKGTADSAFVGMRGGGGHAMRKLVSEGLIPDSGSLAARVDIMKSLLVPVLERPNYTFSWRVGSTPAKGFIGEVQGRDIFVFVATDGPYRSQVISSGVVTQSDWSLWGLIP